MGKAGRVCSTPGCPVIVPTGGKCPACATAADRARGTPAERGYGHAHRTRFRRGVFDKHPWCVWPGCTERSTVADHWPLSRRELVAAGMDPDSPANGRGLCKLHHDQHTAQAQPGGWNVRD